MKRIELPGGIKVVTYERPPHGFNPLTASDSELRRFGFPHRPQDPRDLELYTSVLGRLHRKLNYVEPTFRVHVEEDRYSPRLPPPPTAGLGEVSDNWSGGVVYAPAGDSFHWIHGQWMVPNVDPPADNEWYHAWSWIGLDGDGSPDVCQAGVRCEVYRSGSTITREFKAWWEWWPSPAVDLTDFAISPGDQVSIALKALAGAGENEATVYISNLTQGNATSMTFTAPGTTRLVGNCAEWIMERPRFSGKLSQLADYGDVYFSNCRATTRSGTGVSSGSGKQILMTDDGGTKVISQGMLVTSDLIQCHYTGPP